MNYKFQPYLTSLDDPIKEEQHEEDLTWNSLPQKVYNQNNALDQVLKNAQKTINTTDSIHNQINFNYNTDKNNSEAVNNQIINSVRNSQIRSGTNTPIMNPKQTKILKLKVNLVL